MFLGFRKEEIFSRKCGFTLIELLVVVGIIALLSSLTAVVARETRDRGRDTRIQTSLSQVRFEAAMIYNTNNSYMNLCDGSNTLNEANDNLKIIEDEVRRQSGSEPICYVGVDGDSYCIQSPLVSGGAYCIDSTGYAGEDAINCAVGHPSCH